jgi:hypothetical protein
MHVPFSTELASLIDQRGSKTLLVIRDLRDVVVSHARFAAENRRHYLYSYYQGISDSERISSSIAGIGQSFDLVLLDIYQRCKSILPWAEQPFNYTCRFESLVGKQGGGTREAQIRELEQIGQHLGLRFDRRDIRAISKRLFGGTHTFRKGKIGTWRECLTPEHKRLFKELAGQILIELGYEHDLNW